MDFVKTEVVRDHVQIPLTVKEFRVLEFMIKKACCRPISRDENVHFQLALPGSVGKAAISRRKKACGRAQLFAS